MLTYLQPKNITHLRYYLFNKTIQTISSYIDKFPKNIDSFSINKWSELQNILHGQTFFETENKINLININTLDLTKNIIKNLQNLDTQNTTNYLYSTDNLGQKAQWKKLWKDAAFEYIIIPEISPFELVKIAKTIADQNKLNITDVEINKLVKNSPDLDELLNNLYLIEITQDPQIVMQTADTKEKTAPFMLGFDVSKGLKNSSEWLNLANENENQLAISLIFGKLKKQNSISSQNLITNLIQTDHKIKTNSKLPASIWYKYFLWQATFQSNEK